jgi:ribosomal protein S18 acetylase RimI-like enzyme
MEDLKIRKVTLSEAAILLNLSRQTFFDAFAERNNAADMNFYAAKAFTLTKIESELNEPLSRFYFAVVDDETVGYLKINTGAAQNELNEDGGLEVERIYILAKHQGKQFGGILLNFAIQLAKSEDHGSIWLGVWENNYNAIRFYERCGFVKFGSHQFMLGNDEQTDNLMKKQLNKKGQN